MVASSVLGFPRIGPKREIKKATEAYWAGKSSQQELAKVAQEIRLQRWNTIKDAGVDLVPSGEFTLYDHVLNHIEQFGLASSKYADSPLSPLDRAFAMGRGHQKDGVDLPAMEMRKWFDSNYHYLVPEVSSAWVPKLGHDHTTAEYLEAKQAGIETRPVIVGPISLLLLGKVARDEKDSSFKPIQALDKLVPVYVELLKKLSAAGAKAVQIDEPYLVMDATTNLGAEYTKVFTTFNKEVPDLKIALTTYFGRLDSNIEYVAKLPIDTLHVDVARHPEQLAPVVAAIKGTPIKLSLGVVSGRNVWKNDFAASIKLVKTAIETLGKDRVVVATSSSLLHTPVTLANETKLPAETLDWFSFATEKVKEVAVIAKAIEAPESVKAELDANAASIKARRTFEEESDPAVRARLAAVKPEDYERKSKYPARKEAQYAVQPLPLFPTSTIGSFPQTKEIRLARAKLNKGELSDADYNSFIEKEIETVIRFQEKVGLDLLVHGEPERNDMVQYFGERLAGFVFTQEGWVQSYGSRYVRPPIVVSDISRPEAMTVKWSSFAQSLSKQPVKGMLSGPATITRWSFPRADINEETQYKQIALALRDEVNDLEAAGIFAIQVDEPAIREGLPLRESDWDAYLKYAVDSFRLATSGVQDKTQIHSHFCYSDFTSIFQHIINLDADVISIEASKSDMILLKAFDTYGYPNAIGPGIFDIHSPRVAPLEEMQAKIAEILKAIPNAKDLWVHPDCGLKTRGWTETEKSLENLVGAAKWARETYGNKV